MNNRGEGGLTVASRNSDAAVQILVQGATDKQHETMLAQAMQGIRFSNESVTEAEQ